MLTKTTSTAAQNDPERPKKSGFHELCIKSAVTVSIAIGTLKFIWHEVEWVVNAVWAWIR